MIKKTIIGVITLVIIAAVIFFIVSNGTADKNGGNKTLTVSRGTIIDKALAIGQIEPENEIAVKSKISGIVRKTFVDVGDRVSAGDPLFDIAPDPTPLEFAEARRQVEMAQVLFRNVQQEFERTRSLLDKQLISTQEYESKKADYDEAELRLKLAREKLALIDSGETRVADRSIDNIIKSPIDGTVLSMHVEEGDPVVPLTSYQAGTELMTLAQMDDLMFKGTVDEIDVGKLALQMPVEIEVGALPGSRLSGNLTRISPKARRQEGATVFDVEIVFDDLGREFLRAGYSANADIIISKRESVLVIPERLVTMTDSSTTVEVQDSLGNIARRDVVIGLSDGITVEITSGLAEGELIVERPPREIRPFD
ncbi:MAG TPA: efflux RND transporter periplasmic adaptor subunit [Acidobacteriota bacterium]|nr:efflux RND transporter periplasmic adaptor subunit [Acidobacteriota bacterium]